MDMYSRSGRDNFQNAYLILDVTWVEYKVDSETLGDRQRYQMCIGGPWKWQTIYITQSPLPPSASGAW